MSHLLCHIENHVMTLTINRPEARNAFTYEMYDALATHCAQASQRDDVRLVVIEGTAGVFGSGTDIALFNDLKTEEDSRIYEARIEGVLSTIEQCEKPTIAAISGICTGGAAVIAACCDLRIGTAKTRIGFPIARTLGNCLSAKNLDRMSMLIGGARVKYLIFTAELMEGKAAEAAGFLNECLDDAAALAARITALSETIVSHAPLTLFASKVLLQRLRDGNNQDEDMVSLCYTSADFREGMTAFLGKRQPKFKGE